MEKSPRKCLANAADKAPASSNALSQRRHRLPAPRQGRQMKGLRMKAARTAAVMALVSSVMMFVAAPANAGLLVASAPDCTTGTLTKPFSPWGDNANYVLGPGGSFEGG